METIQQMPPESRLWVYQSNRKLSAAEVEAIREKLNAFIAGWSAHGANLLAASEVLYNIFIVLTVDEKQALATGCSIDKSVHFMKGLEMEFDLSLFDRMNVAYREGKEIKICTYPEFEKLAAQHLINEETIVFNNMVCSVSEFNNDWEVPLKDSWQKRALY